MKQLFSLPAMAGLGLLLLTSSGTVAQSKQDPASLNASGRKNARTNVQHSAAQRMRPAQHGPQSLHRSQSGHGLTTAFPLPVRSTNKGDASQEQFLNEERGGAPLNNNCSGATSLTMGTTCNPTAGNVDQATQSLAALNCAGFTGNANDDVWYSFVATASNATIVLECNTSFDGVIDLRSGACNGTNIACMDNYIAGGTETLLATGLTVGSTYRFRVYDYEAGYPTDPTFTVCVFGTPDAPANDLCVDAVIQDITVPGSASVSGDNTGATDTEGLGTATAWEAFTIDACADVTVNYCGTDPAFGNFFIALATDCDITGVVDATEFPDCGDGNLAILYADLPAGTYYIPVLTEAGSEGPYTIEISAVACGGGVTPPNDLCEDAVIQDITVPGSATVNGDNTGATDSEGLGTATAWEAFTIDACADVTVNYCGTDPVFGNFFISITTDCSFATVITSTDFPDCGDGNLAINFPALDPGTYYVPVLTEPGAEGPYTIEITAVACGGGTTPPNDLCEDAVIQDITVPGSATVNGDNTGATDTEGFGTPTAWEAFTIDACADVTVSYCGTSPAFENAFLNLSVDCAGSGVVEFFDFDVTACGDGNVTIYYEDVPAGTYYYPVLTEPGAVGPYTITFTAVDCGVVVPGNDQCGDAVAEALNVGSSVVFTGDNTGATMDNDYEAGSAFESLGLPSVWHAFTTTECADVTVSYCGTSPAFLDFWVVLATSCPANDDVIFNSSYNTTECGDDNGTIHFTALPAGTYYLPVMLDTAEATQAQGPYTVEVSAVACAEPPANDDCSGAITLEVNLTCEPTNGTVFGATESMPSIACNGFTGNANDDVWYAFEATSPNATITVQGVDTLDAVLELLEGTCGNFTSLDCADATLGGGEEEIVANDLTPGNIYYVRVYDWYNGYPEAPDFSICIVGDIGTGVAESQSLSTQVRPNPSNGDLSFTYAGKTASVQVELIDMTGRLVHAQRNTLTTGQQVDLSLAGKLAAGTYTLRLTTQGAVSEQRVMVR